MMFGRTIGVFLLLAFALSGGGLYYLGYRHGLQQENDHDHDPGTLTTSAVEGSAHASSVKTARAATGETFSTLLTSGAWHQLERWLVSHQQRLTPAHGDALIQGMAGRINKYDAMAMRRVLRSYLVAVPDDNAALLLLSDLQQIGGMREAALENLLKIIDFPSDDVVVQQARQQAHQIISLTDTQLRNRGALAESEAFWRYISQRLPTSDRYRYEWARVLAELRRFDEAKRILQETGATDIAQATVDELLLRIENTEAGLQFEFDTEGDRMLANATIPGGVTLRLLVDTGANVTSLSSSALRMAGAKRLRQEASVRTASGVVTTGVYEMAELEVQGTRFTDLRVLELPAQLPGLDGLLGQDILRQLTIDPLGVRSG